MVRGPVIWVPSITHAWGSHCRHCSCCITHAQGLLLQGSSKKWLYKAITKLLRDEEVSDGELETAGNSLREVLLVKTHQVWGSWENGSCVCVFG